MGGAHLEFAYEEVPGAGNDRRFRPRIGFATSAPVGSDTDGFLRGMISITPLQFDWTAYSVIDQVRGWGLTHTVAR